MIDETMGLLYISIILQLLNDGEADISDLSPAVKSFILGIQDEFEHTPEGDNKDQFYYAANTLLEVDKNKLN
jgi:aspartyl aminopeptidase